MPAPVVYVDTSAVRDGRLDALEAAMKDLAAFVEANVPRIMSYGFFLDAGATRMTVVSVHPDSESLRYHMEVGRERFRSFSELIELLRIDVYGRVDDAALELLHGKARALGTGPVAVHDLYAGFSRLHGN